ncbi:hypothetical protein CRUP_023370, partial [Coryphaenoides rupestris]
QQPACCQTTSVTS